MNAERLHVICVEVAAAIESVGLAGKLKQVIDALQSVVNQPQNPNQQQVLTH